MSGAPRSHGMFQPRVTAQPRELGADQSRVGAWCAKVLTLFPEMFPGPLAHSLLGKALKEGLWRLETLDIRRFATDKHRTVDDTPFGGGPGMVMKPDVLAAAIDHAEAGTPGRARWPLVYLSPRGRPFDQATAERLAAAEGVTLLCGRYEGVDQRVLDARGAEEICVGDAVLTGGEIPAMVLIDAAVRLRPGVLGNESSKDDESFSRGLLEHPHYTRPPVWEGRAVPEVLLSGHHANIAAWRRSQGLALTQERRPDLWRAHGDPDGAAEQSDVNTSAVQGGPKKEDDR